MAEKENRCFEVYSDTIDVKEKLRMNKLIKQDWFKRHNISIIIYIVLLLSEITSNYVIWSLGILYLGCQIIRRRGKLVIRRFWGENILFVLILLGGIIGLKNVCAGRAETWPYIRDMLHISSIILVCFFFSNMAERYLYDMSVVYNTVFFFCGTYSMVITLFAIPNYLEAESNIYEYIISRVGISESILAIGLYLTFFRSKIIGEFYVNTYIDRILGIAIIIAVMLAFSRTMILFFVSLCAVGLVKHTKQIFKIFVVILLGILLITQISPGVIESYGTKISHSFQEISSSQPVWNETAIVQNWRGYEVYCAKQEYRRFTLLEQILGRGFGATVDVGDYAYLVTSEDTLPYLHNGYYTTLIKNGILGIVLIVLYWCSLFYGIKKKSISKYEKDLAWGIVIGMALSMFFIHGVFWGGNEEVFYLFLVWLKAKSNCRGNDIKVLGGNIN